MNLPAFLVCLFVFLTLFSCAEQKKRKMRIEQKKLRELCRLQRRSSSPGTALELHAYFNLQSEEKPFACLKVTTCIGTPVCFVTTHSSLRSKSINDTTTWQDLITFIQRDRKIEPIFDRPMSGWNSERDKAISHYIHQPPIYRMCRNAAIYRFVINENVTNTTNSAMRSSPGNASQNPTLNPAMSLCPLFKDTPGAGRHTKEKSARTKRIDRSKNKTTENFFQCQGLNCPCVRICVSQGSKQNFTECSKFRIICTFNCSSETIVVPKNPIVTRPTKRPTKRPRRRPTKRPRRRPTKRPRRRPSKRPRRRPTKRPTKKPIGRTTKRPRRRPTKQATERSKKRPTRQPRRPPKKPTRRPRKPEGRGRTKSKSRNKKTRPLAKG